MIVGGSKQKVIENIKNNANNNELNNKCETDDLILTDEETDNLIKHFYKVRKNKLLFSLKQRAVKKKVNALYDQIIPNLEIIGIDKIKNIKSAIITSNHFNPLDSLPIRKMVNDAFNKDVYTVTDANNLSLPEPLHTIVEYLDNIPLKRTPSYIIKSFTPEVIKTLKKNNYILIYPEEEMWFNYKKPRPCKRGSYEFAYKAGVPIIPCYVEQINTDVSDNDEFNVVKYRLHILDPIYPNLNENERTESKNMALKDYEEKVKCYEEIYNTKLDYKFEYSDIAGLKKGN